MIQRIQTIYFLAAIVIQSFLFTFPAWKGETRAEAYPSKKVTVFISHTTMLTKENASSKEITTETNYPLNTAIIVLNSLIILGAIATIFMFRNRKIQSLMAGILALLVCVLGVLIFLAAQNGIGLFNNAEHSSAFMASQYLPIASLLLFFLASRAIKADEKLVRSADRLR